MGLYIDMEMPKNCHDCEMSALVDVSDGLAYGCRALKEMIFNDRERLPNCPLVPVPEPHGRLIDADALDTGKMIDVYIRGDLYRHEWNIDEWLNSAPTIIPASEEE